MKPLFYTGAPLDRGEALRHDDRWQRDRLADARSRIFPVWREHNLIAAGDTPAAMALPPGAALLERADVIVFLGLDEEGRACFAVDISTVDEPALADLKGEGRFTTLRRVGPLMDRGDGAILATARALILWHRRHRFCSVCGARAESRDAGHLRACVSSECGALHFPRSDPAVIMLVTQRDGSGERCLLGRQAKWPKGMMSTLAGFVEPGETLEEAVAREVDEETGIRIARPCYRGSQPWPFPASLMLGFRAEAVAGVELRVNATELEDARWFSRSEIRGRRSSGLILPGRDSIARRLIEDWLDEDEGEGKADSEEAQPCPAW